METQDHTLVKHLKTDPENAPLEAQDRAMIDFALKLTKQPSDVKREDTEFLQQYGFSEENVVDIVLITCTFNFMDRLADGLGVELDPQMQKIVDANANKG
ncbi:MAG TPA: peroxidase [Nitrospirales bacterium]|nr:peroxidase [Nitrospirales bacterium]